MKNIVNETEKVHDETLQLMLKAQELMKKCLAISPDDPPTVLLLKVMNDGDAPSDWNGYRELTSK